MRCEEFIVPTHFEEIAPLLSRLTVEIDQQVAAKDNVIERLIDPKSRLKKITHREMDRVSKKGLNL